MAFVPEMMESFMHRIMDNFPKGSLIAFVLEIMDSFCSMDH